LPPASLRPPAPHPAPHPALFPESSLFSAPLLPLPSVSPMLLPSPLPLSPAGIPEANYSMGK